MPAATQSIVPAEHSDATDPLLRAPAKVGWRERIEQWWATLPLSQSGTAWTPWRLGAVLVFVAALAFASWAVFRAPPSPPPELSLERAPRVSASEVSGAAPSSSAGATPDPSTTPSTIVVHAAGAVTSPGVYRLSLGSRVADLLDAAGGAAGDAAADRLNLAAILADGERFYVPRRGEEPPPEISAQGSASGGTAASGSSGESESGATTVHVNSATMEELDTLPGVGPATAQAIMQYRQQHGPFQVADELLEVRGIGPAKLEQLRPLVRI